MQGIRNVAPGHTVVQDGIVYCSSEAGDVYGRQFANTYARPMVGYLNEGVLWNNVAQLRHQCMDAGTRTSWGTPLGLTANGDAPGFLTTAGSTTLLGNWGQSAVAWRKNDFRAMIAVPSGAPTDPQGNCLLPMRPFAPADAESPAWSAPPLPADFAPTWTWRSVDREDWARASVFSAPAWLADVDGDGLVDAFSRRDTHSDYLSEAFVQYTRRFARGERPDGRQAQVPFAIEDTIHTSIAPRDGLVPTPGLGLDHRAFYVDINGDGLVDLVTSNPDDNNMQGNPEVRPGDGRGNFACVSSRQPDVPGWGCLDNGGLTPFYRLEFTSTGALPFDGETFFHDVTGDGLADLVKLKPSYTTPGALELLVYVNMDGHTFSCVGVNGCSVGVFLDTVHTSFDVGTVDERKLAFADMDANGIDEPVLVTRTGIHVATVMPTREPSVREHAPRPGLLTRIDNGRGATTRLVYKTIQELDLAARGSPEPWEHHSRLPGTVVTTMRTEDSVVDASWQTLPEPFGVERATSFTYRDPAYDRWQGRVLGFRRITEKLEGESAVTETTYRFSACQNDSLRELNGNGPEQRCIDGDEDEWEYAQQAARKPYVGRPIRVERYVPGVAGRNDAQYLWSKLIHWGVLTGA